MAETITPDQLSMLLFQMFVLEDEVKVREKDLGQYLLNTKSQDLIFTKHVYFYLAGLVAVALTSEFESRQIIAEVMAKFRNVVIKEALRRWSIFQDEVDGVVNGSLKRV